MLDHAMPPCSRSGACYRHMSYCYRSFKLLHSSTPFPSCVLVIVIDFFALAVQLAGSLAMRRADICVIRMDFERAT
jgi:hypothetical protein